MSYIEVFQKQFAHRICRITSLMYHVAQTAPRRGCDSARYEQILKWDENELVDEVLSLFTDDARTILGAPSLSLEWLRDNLPHIGAQNRGCGIYTILGISGSGSQAIYVGCSYTLRYRIIAHESALRTKSSKHHVYDVLSSYDRNEVFFRKIIEGQPLSRGILFLVESIMMILLDTIHSRINSGIHPPGLIASIMTLQKELNLRRSVDCGHPNKAISLFVAWDNTTYQVTHANPGYCEDCGVPESIRCIYASNFFGKWLCRRCRVSQRILLIPPDHELFNPCGWCGKPALRTLKMPRRDLETGKLYCWACFIYHRNHGSYHFLSCAQDITCACINCDSIVAGPNRDAQRIRSHDGKWYCNWCWYWAAEHPNEEHIHERPGQCSCKGCLVYANVASPKERWLRLSPDGHWLCPWCLASDPDEPHDHVACVCPGCPRRNDQAPWGLTELGPMCGGCARHLRLHPTWPHRHGPTPCQCPYGGHTGQCPAVLQQTSHPNATFMCKNCYKFDKRVKKGQNNQLHDHDAIRLRMQPASVPVSP